MAVFFKDGTVLDCHRPQSPEELALSEALRGVDLRDLPEEVLVKIVNRTCTAADVEKALKDDGQS